MKTLQTKRRVESLNIDFYDLFYTLTKKLSDGGGEE